eukprot:COSAG02_NODE_170_length_31534_cov_33.568498_11_plen_109_part_00
MIVMSIYCTTEFERASLTLCVIGGGCQRVIHGGIAVLYAFFGCTVYILRVVRYAPITVAKVYRSSWVGFPTALCSETWWHLQSTNSTKGTILQNRALFCANVPLELCV